MGRKVFISVLGTGFYGRCKYVNDVFISTSTRFIQQAMLELHNVKSWEKKDSVYILLTSKAEQVNWDIPSTKRKNSRGEEEEYRGLKQIIEEMDLASAVEGVHIADGKNEEEMWSIFETVFGLLQEEDELYFDLTHSFRYLPMLILVLGNYAKFLKQVRITSVSYGNYEARDVATGYAPIIDLLPLTMLQDWTSAAAAFIRYGNAEGLIQLSREKINPIMQETQGKDEKAGLLRGYVSQLETFINEVRFCRGIDLYEANAIISIKKYAAQLEDTFIRPLNPLLAKITKELSPFVTRKSGVNNLMAAQWCFGKGQYQAAVTLLQEGIVTVLCERYNIAVNDDRRRDIVNSAFYKRSSQIQGDREPYRAKFTPEDEMIVDRIASDELLSDALVDDFSNLTEIRNDFNHAGMRKNPKKVKKLRDNIEECLNNIAPLLLGINQSKNLKGKKPSFLINLSNHPYSLWSEGQKEAAKQYGGCQDMPFPIIDPFVDSQVVFDIAKTYAQQILKMAKDADITVHVMGEMCFTFDLIGLLQDAGIPCISSTSYRITEDLPDGSKRIEFQFKRFRKYGR